MRSCNCENNQLLHVCTCCMQACRSHPLLGDLKLNPSLQRASARAMCPGVFIILKAGTLACPYCRAQAGTQLDRDLARALSVIMGKHYQNLTHNHPALHHQKKDTIPDRCGFPLATTILLMPSRYCLCQSNCYGFWDVGKFHFSNDRASCSFAVANALVKVCQEQTRNLTQR